MSKLGAHVTQGGRTGYGPYCSAKPAVVLAANEGGALVEAKANSGGHAFTVFRDTTVYLDAPHGIDQATPEQARQMADNHWPVLRAKWQQNPADAYTVLNEPAGHDQGVMPSYLAYELRMMELAEADGLRLCILNLATGTPDFDVWQAVYAPHIARAFQGGHVYGRHLYDGNGLTRALAEAAWLHEQGIVGGIVITEAGLNGGYGYVGDEAWLAWTAQLDEQLREQPLIIGACLWTLGDWNGANWQSALPEMTAYLAANPSPKWTPPEEQEPPMDTVEERLWQHSIEEQTERGFHRAPTALQAAVAELEPQGYRYVTRETYPDGLPPYIAVEDFSGEEKPRRVLYWIGGQVKTITDPAQPQPFRFEAWPTNEKRVTQRFGANPAYYAQFGLPGHEGVDIAAAHNTPVYAVAAGTVYLATGNQGNYGVQVRIDHGNGWKTVYAHNASLLVKAGDKVQAGQQIARADNTGNSSGSHLHLTLKRDGQPTPGWPADIVDPTPFLAPFNPAWPGASTPQPTPGTIDLLPYFLPVPGGNGPLFELRWPDGKQERTQVQSDGAWFYVTKGSGGIGGASEWEQLRADATYIWRGLDTSPGEGYYYWQRETGNDAARWCKRHMFVGETFVGAGHHVQFYHKSNCQPADVPWNGPATNRVTFLAHHAAWQSPSGLVLNDVVELGDPAGEVFFLARGIGMVGWRSPWGTSGISELHAPGARPDNVRERLCS